MPVKELIVPWCSETSLAGRDLGGWSPWDRFFAPLSALWPTSAKEHSSTDNG